MSDDVYCLGDTSRLVATELASLTVAKQRRKVMSAIKSSRDVFEAWWLSCSISVVWINIIHCFCVMVWSDFPKESIDCVGG